MGAKEDVQDFIDSIPASKLQHLPRKPQSRIHFNSDYRLDMQQMTTIGDLHVLAVQVNNKPKKPTLKRAASGRSSPVVGQSIKVGSGEDELDPEEVRKQLKEAVVKPCNNR